MPTLDSTTLFGGLAASATAGGAEVAAHANGRIFVLGPDGIDVRDPATGAILYSIDTTALGNGNSVAAHGDRIAVALAASPNTDPGVVAFFDVTDTGATLAGTVTVGANPDQLVFTADGGRVLVANEGEPTEDNSVNPEGSVSVIDTATFAVQTAGFTAFDGSEEALRAKGLRLVGDAPFSQEAEPEYIALSADGTRAYVTLQEVNAVGVLDLTGPAPVFTDILGLGFKDHSLAGNGIDASDRDGLDGNIQTWPVFGIYQPDGIATLEFGGETYFVTANEGDTRIAEVNGGSEEARIKDLTLDPTAFPNAAALQLDGNLGRLTVTTTLGDTDGDGDYDALYAFGGRSFSIWKEEDGTAVQVFDSGELLEQTILSQFPELWDDGRSDNKGPEPESVTIGAVDGGLYAFVALERSNAVMAFHIETPDTVTYAGLLATEGDLAPEVSAFIPAGESASGLAELVVANEGSGTVSGYVLEVSAPQTFKLQILHASDLEAGLQAVDRMGNFAALVDKFEDEAANSLTLISGDAWIPGPFYAAESDTIVRDALREYYGNATQAAGGGRVSVAVMNEIGVDAASFGNHEFDLGPNAIADAILPSSSNNGANFPYISANLTFPEGSPLAGAVVADGQDAAGLGGRISGWVTTEVGGETVAIIGVTTQILASISSVGNTIVEGGPNNDTDILAALLQPVIDEASLVTDKIVLMGHLQQYTLEMDLAGKLSGVDIIISGGSHALFADETDTVRAGDTVAETYPLLLTDRDGNTTLQVNTAGEYAYLGRLVVEFDGNGHIIADSIDPLISGAWATTDEVVADVYAEELADDDASNDPFAEGSKGANVEALAEAVGSVIDAKDGNILGYTEVFLEGRRGLVRTEETNLGNLTADANLYVARQYDASVQVSIKNGGGVRAEIGTFDTGEAATPLPPAANPAAGKPEGGVSQLDIENSLRFNNTLALTTVTVAELEQIVEYAVAQKGPGITAGQFGQFGGLAFSYDPSEQAIAFDNVTGAVLQDGLRVQTLALIDDDGNVVQTLVRDGQIVADPNQEIRIVTLNFMAAQNGTNATGGDGYPIPIFGEDTIDLSAALTDPGLADFAAPGSEQDALAEYLKANFSTPETAYSKPETSEAEDTRIQNLAVREDTVEPAAVLDFTLWQTAVGVGARDDRGFDASSWRGALIELDRAEGDETLIGVAASGDQGAIARIRSTEGDVSIDGASFDNDVTLAGQGELLAVTWAGRSAVLDHTATWNTIKTAVVTDFTGEALTLRGFVHNVVDLGGNDAGLDLALDGAKRGFVRLGAGDDTIEIGAVANIADWSRLFDIATGDGDDTVSFVAASSDFGQAIGDARIARSLIDLGAGDDIFVSGAGDDTVSGGDGFDTAIFSGAFADYTITALDDGALRVSGLDGIDTLTGFERLTFADQIFAV